MNKSENKGWSVEELGDVVHIADMLYGQISSDRQPFKEAQLIKCELIDPNPYQPRKSLNPEDLEELIASVKEVGLLQPLLVISKDERYILVAGERRLTATKTIGLEYVPCIIRNLAEDELLRFSLVENLQREDLTPLEEANAIKLLIDSSGYSYRQIAELLGKSKSFVADRLALLKMPEDIENAVEKKRTPLKKALILKNITDDKTRQDLVERSTRLDVDTLKEAANFYKPDESYRPSLQEPILDYSSILNQVSQISSNIRLYRNRISIQFKSVEILKNLLTQILDKLDEGSDI